MITNLEGSEVVIHLVLFFFLTLLSPVQQLTHCLVIVHYSVFILFLILVVFEQFLRAKLENIIKFLLGHCPSVGSAHSRSHHLKETA